MAPKSQRKNSVSSSKCPGCKKVVKDDDSSAIGCHSCRFWFHGECVSLTVDEVQWLGARSNCLWLCNSGLSSPSEAKFSILIVENIDKKITSSLKQLLPKILSDALPTALTENFQKAVTDSLPSYRDALQRMKLHTLNNWNQIQKLSMKLCNILVCTQVETSAVSDALESV